MKCTHCGKPIKLVPSAKERAKKYGNTPRFYERLFTVHADCLIKSYKHETSQLIAKLAKGDTTK
jgi:hypothetical protein